MKITSIIAAAGMMTTTSARAECDLSEVVGWTLIAEKTVKGYADEDERSDGYKGCKSDRILIFTDNTALRCGEYIYDYAYRPDAYIFSDGKLLTACIDDEMIDLRPLR